MSATDEKTVAIVQARMGSTRFPGKVLEDIDGKPMLLRVTSRLKRARRVNSILVATTTRPIDDEIVDLCEREGVPFFRGAETDVLDRYYRAAVEESASIVVRITSDCPLVDPAVVDQVIWARAEAPVADVAANTIPPRTFPRGLDVEVFTFAALQSAWRDARDPISREHVTPFLYSHPSRFHVRRVSNQTDESSHRWTVDVPDDLTLVRKIFGQYGRDNFGWLEVLGLLRAHPDWVEINKHVRQKEPA